MKIDKLIDAIGNIDDRYIEEAHSIEVVKEKRNYFTWANFGKLSLATLCLLLFINIIPNMFSSFKNDYQTSDATNYGGEAYETGPYEIVDGDINYKVDDETSNNELVENKKMILTADLNLETQNLDELVNNILDNVKKYNAYVQYSNINSYSGNTRKYEATIRIPADKYQDFIKELKDNGNVLKYSEELEDVTEHYNDIEARINSLKAQEEKVLEFYKQAETIEELMSIESRLADLRYQIETYETKLKNYDLLINYSTLHITINETKVYTTEKPSFIKRLGNSFISGFNNFISNIGEFVIDFVYNIWTIIFLVVLGFVGYIIFKKIRNKKNK